MAIILIASALSAKLVNKLSLGYIINKRRRFAYSRLKEALGNNISKRFMEEQIEILEANVVITRPTRRSVELSRRLCATAQNYLITSCEYSMDELNILIQNNRLLTD